MGKVLVTGAAGFIGSQLAYRLFKAGEELILLDNFSYGSEDNLIFKDHDFRKEVIVKDIRDKSFIEGIFEQGDIDYCYHIAAITPLPDCQSNPCEAADVNITGTINILEAGRKYGVKKIIFASTSAVYENTYVFPSKEDNVVIPSLVYPNTKYTAECFCRAFADVYGMNITVLRFANVYGPHIDCLRTQPPVVGYLIREYYYDRSPILHSNGEQKRDYIYVEDLVDLCLRVKEGEGFDIVNVATNTETSVNELAERVAKLMGKVSIVPTYVDSENYWKNYPQLYEGAYRVSEEALNHEVNKYTRLDNSHAFDKYGWYPKVDLEEGLKKTIDFSVKIIGER